MEWLIAPFEVGFVQRALWGGLLVSCVCALAGTWVVVRGMAFLGDAMAHGMLPGVAIASLIGGNLLLGAAFSAVAMAWGVSALGRNPRFSADTSIGLLFVGMLSLGVLIVSRSQSFAVDVTGFLFGDVLAITHRDLAYLAGALIAAVAIALFGHRAFVALSFDARKAQTLGLRPRLAHAALLGLVTLAIVASFHLVGTLLVFGLLIAPPAAAAYWANRIPVMMALAALFGAFATVSGVVVSWHAGTATGATIAVIAVGLFFVSMLASWVRDRVRLHGGGANTIVALSIAAIVLPLAGCGASAEETATESTPHGYVSGAEETAEEQPRLVLADRGTGAIRVLDLMTEKVTEIGAHPEPDAVARDDRYVYVSAAGETHVVDAGSWVVDHGDHQHYYRAAARELGTLDRSGLTAVHGDSAFTALVFGATTVLLDRSALDAGKVIERRVVDGLAVPYAEHLVVALPDGRVEVHDRDDVVLSTLAERCANPRGAAVTRRGIVFGCAEGAVVVRHEEGRFTVTKIPYPHEVPDAERATAFTHRPGSTTLVSVAGTRGVWVLDIRSRTWRLVESGPAVAANTAGEGSALLVLTRDGVLHGYDPTTGAHTSELPLLDPVEHSGTVIEIDTGRAYINDSSAHVVHEIDYRDNLRHARTLPLDIAPTYLVETGR